MKSTLKNIFKVLAEQQDGPKNLIAYFQTRLDYQNLQNFSKRNSVMKTYISGVLVRNID